MEQSQPTRSVHPLLWFGLTCLLVFGLTLALRNREPTYHAKPFSYWLDQIPCTVTRPNGSVSIMFPHVYETKADLEAHAQKDQEIVNEGLQAVTQIGRQCLPLLLQRMRSKDSVLKIYVTRWATRLHLVPKYPTRDTDLMRGQALTAILKLDTDAKPLLPGLISLAQNTDPKIRAAARYAVRELSPKDYKRLQQLQQTGPTNTSGK